MNEIHQKVSVARRRMFTGRFFSVLTQAIFVGMIVALIGVAIPKIWHLDFLQDPFARDAWLYSWIVGSIVLGMIATAVITFRTLGSKIDTAVEIDRRFGLKERLSSALNLSDEDAQSQAGKALIQDAEVKAQDIDIAEEFRFKPTWHALLPLAPMALLLVLFFVPDAQMTLVAEETPAFDKKQVELQVKEFKKKVEEKRKQLEAKGLKDASADLKSLGNKFDKLLSDPDKSQKDTLIQLNDIKKEIEDRRKELGDSKEFKKNLNQLKDVGKGPAKKLANALAEGDFEKAKDAVKQLADSLKDGKLTEEDMKKLAEDLNKLAEAIQKANENREREIQELKDKLEKAKQEGDLEKAAKLQEQLEKKQQQQKQMQKMNDLAEKLKECAQCSKPGQGKPGEDGQPGQPSLEDLKNAMKEAGESLEDIAEQMESLQKQMEEMEALEDLENMAEECKGQCQGQGQGQGDPNKPPQWNDWAKGAGNGQGLRDRADDETGNFKARVKADVTKGETVVTGTADGKNITGRTVSETKELVRGTMESDVDPMENQKLTKKQLEHAQQYFKALREQ